MTKDEIDRLRRFIKEYGPDERLAHTWILIHKQGFLSPYGKGPVKIKDLLKEDTYMDIPFNKIMKISLWISTKYGTFYF